MLNLTKQTNTKVRVMPCATVSFPPRTGVLVQLPYAELSAWFSQSTEIQGSVCKLQFSEVQIDGIFCTVWIKLSYGKISVFFSRISPPSVENEFRCPVWVLSKPVEINSASRSTIIAKELRTLSLCCRHFCLLGFDPVCSLRPCNINHTAAKCQSCCQVQEGNWACRTGLSPERARARSEVKINLISIISCGFLTNELTLLSVCFKLIVSVGGQVTSRSF